ncbi:hypothetical protein BC673_11176 [Prevotella pallens]|uniref:Uncharacterized protein n=1 Tax=Prevotella pallens TaxID=60133 RepID=A0ABX9DQZ9_9BACT|nr:hypothetical protein BC673_11176 [Prevotella pallens]
MLFTLHNKGNMHKKRYSEQSRIPSNNMEKSFKFQLTTYKVEIGIELFGVPPYKNGIQ